MSNIPYSRTIGEGKTFLSPTDYQIYIDTKNGIATVVLPKIETVFNYFINGLGNPNSIFGFRFKDLGFAGVNKIVFEGMDNDKINGVQKFDVTKSGASGILMISGINNYTLVSDVGGSAPPTPPFNNPFDFYLDAAAPDGGDGSIEAPFNTITALNNAVIALANPTQSYTAYIAPSNTDYGSEVVGSLNIAQNLSLIGQTPQNTVIGCNISLVSTATPIINQYWNLAINGIFTIDLSLTPFASISFRNGSSNINRVDNNPSAFVYLQSGIGGATISGSVVIESGVVLGDITLNDGSNAGLQYSTLIENRAMILNNQYGLHPAGAGLTTFKSRGDIIGAPITPAVPANNVQVGDILQGFTAIGLTDNGAGEGLIPLAYTQRVIVVQNANGSVACDWEVSLCPLNGTTNSIRKAFGFTSEGIQKCLETTNGMAGVAVLDAAGQIVIANTNVKASTKFMITVQDGGAAPTGNIYQSARVNGTSFTIKSNAGAADAGVQVYYQLYEPIV